MFTLSKIFFRFLSLSLMTFFLHSPPLLGTQTQTQTLTLEELDDGYGDVEMGTMGGHLASMSTEAQLSSVSELTAELEGTATETGQTSSVRGAVRSSAKCWRSGSNGCFYITDKVLYGLTLTTCLGLTIYKAVDAFSQDDDEACPDKTSDQVEFAILTAIDVFVVLMGLNSLAKDGFNLCCSTLSCCFKKSAHGDDSDDDGV